MQHALTIGIAGFVRIEGAELDSELRSAAANLSGAEDTFLKSEFKARAFSYTSHVRSLALGHITHVFSLDELCDACEIHAKQVSRIRDMSPAKRNIHSVAGRPATPLFGAPARICAKTYGIASSSQ